jgi:hypothetical protein
MCPDSTAVGGMLSFEASDWANVNPPADLMAFNAALPSPSRPERMTATARGPAASASEHWKVLIVLGQPDGRDVVRRLNTLLARLMSTRGGMTKTRFGSRRMPCLTSTTGFPVTVLKSWGEQMRVFQRTVRRDYKTHAGIGREAAQNVHVGFKTP